MAVGDALDLADLPNRPVRLVGKARCGDPLVAADGERLVAYHRDVDVQLADGTWRTIEQLRESRSFDLYDHAGSIAIDPAQAAEPLVTIPLTWSGSPAELEEPHRSAVARLEREGSAPPAARATTRSISTVDRLLVLARLRRARDGRVVAEPPPGGYVIASVDLDTAMRLFGGQQRRLLAFAIGLLIAGLALGVIGLVGGLLSGVIGA
jgi:hypothetical protein